MNRSLPWTWATLVLATLFGLGTAEFLSHPRVAAAAIMIIAGVKVMMILRNFMELGEGPIGLRMFFCTWVVACVAVITVFYGMAP